MGENLDFWRRNWRRHRALSVAQLSCTLGACVTAVIREINGHARWSSALVLAFVAGALVLWVMLVRRDKG
jgi:hypothetical protein